MGGHNRRGAVFRGHRGGLFKPKSFAGLFGAAPSVALATLGLTVASNGGLCATIEARSMIGGAWEFLIYTCCECWVMMRLQWQALVATMALMPLWLVSAWAFWFILVR